LPPRQQKFVHPQIPPRLQHIINQVDSLVDIWTELELNQDKYSEEIKWIEEQWYYFLNGYWFYNNGKLTYLDGWHYTYLSHWKFSGGIVPEYRDRDRKWYHAVRYCYTTTERPALDEFGRLIWEDKDSRRLSMVQGKSKVCLGYTDPKGRRAGDSNKHLLAQYMETITHFGKNSGIISSSGDHAKKKLFDEILIAGWQQMPFFYKPITSSNENPDTEVRFMAARRKAVNAKMQDQLRSKIDYSSTATSSQYDGGKEFWLLADEGGKTKDVDVYERHQQLKECVSQGAGINIIGFIGMPSTVGEMEGSGGKKYFQLCADSKYEKRSISGQTVTGLFTIYISCLEGLEGFVDEYGNSVIETPTEQQAAFINKTFGAMEHIESKRQQFLADNETDKYNEFVRLFPVYYRECFRTSDGDIGFNTKIINERLDELAVIEKDFMRTGNFVWSGVKYKSAVKWIDDANGKWRLSQVLHESLTNRFVWMNINGTMQRGPHTPKHITCCDPYKQEKVAGSRMSKGGIATFWDFDALIDDSTADPRSWTSNRFVCTYLNRPGKTSDFYEDVLLQVMYFGSWLYPEVNVAEIIEFAQEKEMAGYFLYDIDWKTGKFKSVPGFYSQGEVKQSLFNSVRDYIEVNGYRERHSDFLLQCKQIEGMEQMTDYDLFTACAGALRGAKSKMIEIATPKTEKKKFGYKKRRCR
jgi:hypothetical protein